MALARRAAFPRFAEFDGQVIRQWMVKGGDESPDEYHVAIDDGTREKAWDFKIGSEPYRKLTPGTFVHARVNLRSRADVTVEPVEPPAVAHPLARVAADQERAVTNGLPDPADLVTRGRGGRHPRRPGPRPPRRRLAGPDDGLAATQHGPAHAAGRGAARGRRPAGAARPPGPPPASRTATWSARAPR